MTLRAVRYLRPGDGTQLRDALLEIDGLELQSVESIDAFAQALADAEVALLPMYLYDRAAGQALRDAPRLRWLQSLSAGVDRFLSDPPSRQVIVTTAGDSMASAIAQHAMGLLLALSRRLPAFLGEQHRARWAPALRREILGLEGRTLAIFGFGAIARQVARRAKAFDMHVIGLRRHPAPEADVDEMVHSAALDDVLPRADAVVLAAPLTPQTRNLFDAARIARMRPGAWLVNVSRGGLVDTDALAAALEAGRLGGAGLDVVQPEPLPATHPLWSAPNLILTPHVAAAGSEASVARFAAENVRRYMAGQPLLARHELAVARTGDR